jgi:hypothetical protein
MEELHALNLARARFDFPAAEAAAKKAASRREKMEAEGDTEQLDRFHLLAQNYTIQAIDRQQYEYVFLLFDTVKCKISKQVLFAASTSIPSILSVALERAPPSLHIFDYMHCLNRAKKAGLPYNALYILVKAPVGVEFDLFS